MRACKYMAVHFPTCVADFKAVWSNGNKPAICVGAKNSHPSISSPLSRADSQATLVEVSSPFSQPDFQLAHSDMDVDPIEENPCQRRRQSPASTTYRTHLHSELPAVNTTKARTATRIKHRTEESTPATRVSTVDHPKPKAPVGGRYTNACSRSALGHEWHVTTANAYSRRYLCLCGYEVHEKKEDGFWTSVSAVFSVLRSPRTSNASECSSVPEAEDPETPNYPALRTRSHTRGIRSSEPPSSDTSPLSVIYSAPEEELSVDAGIEDENSDSGSEYEDAVEELTPWVKASKPDAARRSSGATSITSDAPSSLAGLPHLRRLPGRPGSDVSSPIGRLRQVSSRMVVSDTTPHIRAAPTTARVPDQSPSAVSVAEVSPQRWPLVSDNPKPSRPVATVTPQCEAAPRHLWKLWGNATSRHYTCKLCAFVVKERKSGDPAVWTPIG